MKKAVKTFVVVALIGIGILAPLAVGDVAFAQNPIDEACSQSASASSLCNTSGNSVGDIVGIVVNVLLFVVGLVSVIMIIVGGIRFTTSGGNASSVTAAKNTILYAVIGLIIATLAFAIVNWLLRRF